MNKINRLLAITLVMGLMVVSAMHNDVLAQRRQPREKVLERSKRFPRWAKEGWSSGKYRQKTRGSKNSQLSSKGGTAYWFITDYEFQINRKYKSTGKPFNAPRQDAERFAYAEMAVRLVEWIGTSIKTEVTDKTKYTDDDIEALTDVVNNGIQLKTNTSGFLRVGSAWERISRNGNTYWIIHILCLICKEDYNKIIENNAKAAGVSDELVQTITESITLDREERDVENKTYEVIDISGIYIGGDFMESSYVVTFSKILSQSIPKKCSKNR